MSRLNLKPLIFMCAVMTAMFMVRFSLDPAGDMGELAVTVSNENEGKKKINYIFPLDGAITSVFAIRDDAFGAGFSEFHYGIDISAAESKDILATASGKVKSVSYNESYGKYLIIKHSDSLETLYAHCSRIFVKRNETVKGGEIIAEAGSTGRSTAPHLHFEVRLDSTKIDPMIIFAQNEPLT